MLPLWKSTSRYKIAKGGRGSGKSYGIGENFVVEAIKNKHRMLLTRDVQNTLSDSALAMLKRVIHDHGLDAAFTQTRHGLSCANGTEFLFRGLQNPDRIKSLEGITRVWIEEGQNVAKSALDILIPTIREPGSEIWVSYNPDTETDPIKALEGRDSTVVEVNYFDNPHFPEPLRREMEYDKATDYDKYLWIWEGQPRVVTDSQVFKHKYRVAAFETPVDVDRYYFGADWGFSQDPSTLIRGFIRNQILWIDYEAYGVGVDIDDIPALFATVPRSKDWPVIGDSQRPDVISYLRKNGYQIQSAKKGAGSVEAGVSFLRSFRGVVIHPRCKHAADEFKLYSYKTDKLTGEILPVLEDKHNHIIDALRYALERTMRAAGSIGSAAAAEAGL